MVYTIKDVAKELGVATQTVKIWEKRGIIPKQVMTWHGLREEREYTEDDLKSIQKTLKTRREKR